MSLTPKLLSCAVMMALAGTAAAANTNNLAVGRALGLLQTHGAAIKASPADAYVASDVIIDANGKENVRFQRTYAGLPVLGADFVVHSKNGQFGSASLTLGAPINVNTHPTLSSTDAIVAAGTVFGSKFVGTPTASLMIYARGNAPALAYQVTLQNDDADMTYIVHGKSGKILDMWSNRETAGFSGTGKTEYSGNVALNVNSTSTGYELRDTLHGNSYTTDFNNGGTSKPGTGTIVTSTTSTFGNNIAYGTGSSRATAAADAHYGVGMTWDFYASLGRNGIDGTGRQSYNRVHVGRGYVNAFWSDSCFCMSYGDGDGVTYSPLTDLDVAGHEMSHGVTATTSKLTYSAESGGLNEANSDIMGTMVEFFANNAYDTPDYLIGEKIFINNTTGKALRYMYNPNKDGASASCWYSGVGSLDVHYSSGPANHFFYLLAEGTAAKTFSGFSVTSPTCVAGNTKAATGSATLVGIGHDAATKIWFRGMTVYMTSNTNYAGARVATLKAATDLYGAGSAEYSAVAAAWSAILVN